MCRKKEEGEGGGGGGGEEEVAHFYILGHCSEMDGTCKKLPCVVNSFIVFEEKERERERERETWRRTNGFGGSPPSPLSQFCREGDTHKLRLLLLLLSLLSSSLCHPRPFSIRSQELAR